MRALSALPRLAAAAVLLAAFLPLPGYAVPVVHDLTAASSLSAGLSLAGTATLSTSLGDVTRSFSLSGNLSANPTGQMSIDWGSPGWNDALAIPANGVDLQASNLGSLTGTVTGIDLFSLLTVNLGVDWSFDSITLTGGGFSAPTIPSDGSTPGPGPWAALDSIDSTAVLDSTLKITALGIQFPGIDVPAGPLPLTLPLPLKLSRIGGFPGTGTRASVDLNLPGTLSVPLGAQSYSFPGCEVPIPVIGGCALNVYSLDFDFTTTDISNLQVHIDATSTTAIVPEPGAALLLGVGLAGLAVGRRRQLVAGRTQRSAGDAGRSA